ncbi:hypothetical protein D3C80_797820 [compost metagenome]
MPSKGHEALVEQIGQLVYKAQCHRSSPNHAASEILSIILAALQEPSEHMLAEAMYLDRPIYVWRAMLAASALGEQSE